MKRLALSLLILVLIGVTALIVTARTSRRAPERSFGPLDGRLAPCPETPNCVSSQARSERARVAAFELGPDPERAFEALVELVAAEPRARIERRDLGYVHATYRTPALGFVDDLELLVEPGASVAHVRSASRVGHSDLGANRARVERLRARWETR